MSNLYHAQLAYFARVATSEHLSLGYLKNRNKSSIFQYFRDADPQIVGIKSSSVSLPESSSLRTFGV